MLDALAAVVTFVVLVVGASLYYVAGAYLCVSAFDVVGLYKVAPIGLVLPIIPLIAMGWRQ